MLTWKKDLTQIEEEARGIMKGFLEWSCEKWVEIIKNEWYCEKWVGIIQVDKRRCEGQST